MGKRTLSVITGQSSNNPIYIFKIVARCVRQRTEKHRRRAHSGAEVDEAVLTTKVRGEVMLCGFASNQAQIDRSIAVAKAIEGVANVENHMSLKK
jgi:hypothetical protein